MRFPAEKNAGCPRKEKMAFSTPLGLSRDSLPPPPPPTPPPESVREGGRAGVRSRHNQNFTDRQVTQFAYNGAPLRALPAGSAINSSYSNANVMPLLLSE